MHRVAEQLSSGSFRVGGTSWTLASIIGAHTCKRAGRVATKRARGCHGVDCAAGQPSAQGFRNAHSMPWIHTYRSRLTSGSTTPAAGPMQLFNTRCIEKLWHLPLQNASYLNTCSAATHDSLLFETRQRRSSPRIGSYQHVDATQNQCGNSRNARQGHAWQVVRMQAELLCNALLDGQSTAGSGCYGGSTYQAEREASGGPPSR